MSPYRLVTKALHLLEPETAHVASIIGMKLAQNLHLPLKPALSTPQLATGLRFEGGVLELDNCVGLAAGFDKNADIPLAMASLGFGFVECGTVTPLPQEGNDKPRLFRLTPDHAIINRMGFNNKGLDVFANHLSRTLSHKGSTKIGANIGANKEAKDRSEDYVTGLKTLWGLSDYFTINISSPNTPGLRSLQHRAALDDLLGRLSNARNQLKAATQTNYPLFLKIAPDLSEGEIRDTVESAINHGLDAIIISNTTLSRPDLRSPLAAETGGLSGAPLLSLSNWALKIAYEVAGGRMTLIGVGGISSGKDAYAKIRAGASAVQLYSGLIFKGPDLVHAVRKDLVARLKADGFYNVSEAVGKG